jgi:hypothetical protein
MPVNPLDVLLPTKAYDQVAVFDQDFNQVFPRARPIKAIVKEEAKVMEHPLETGATIVDHRIILPIEIELSLVLQFADYQDAYNQIKQFYLNATLLIVQTKSGVYPNLLIAAMPHEETPEMYDALAVSLKLQEAQFATTTNQFANKNPSQASTVNRGNQQPLTPPTTPDRSYLLNVSGIK